MKNTITKINESGDLCSSGDKSYRDGIKGDKSYPHTEFCNGNMNEHNNCGKVFIIKTTKLMLFG